MQELLGFKPVQTGFPIQAIGSYQKGVTVSSLFKQDSLFRGSATYPGEIIVSSLFKQDSLFR